MYRLYVVYTENSRPKSDDVEMASTVSIISNLSRSDFTFEPRRRRRPTRTQQESMRSQSTVKTQRSNSSRRSGETEESSDSGGSGTNSIKKSRYLIFKLDKFIRSKYI